MITTLIYLALAAVTAVCGVFICRLTRAEEKVLLAWLLGVYAVVMVLILLVLLSKQAYVSYLISVKLSGVL